MKSEKSSGLGDTVQKFTKATGIERLVKAIAGEDCGCEERRKKLNQLFPYAQPLSEDDRKLWEAELCDWENQRVITEKMQRTCLGILERATGKRRKFSRCGSCVRQYFKQAEKLYELSCETPDA